MKVNGGSNSGHTVAGEAQSLPGGVADHIFLTAIGAGVVSTREVS